MILFFIESYNAIKKLLNKKHHLLILISTASLVAHSITHTKPPTGRLLHIVIKHAIVKTSYINSNVLNAKLSIFGITTEHLSKRMNGHRHVVKTNKEKLVSNLANEHNLNFYSCYTTKAKS